MKCSACRELLEYRISSPSTRREWIEIKTQTIFILDILSPSTRREWIEIAFSAPSGSGLGVSLHTEGVD